MISIEKTNKPFLLLLRIVLLNFFLIRLRIINEYNSKRNLAILLKKIKEISDYDFAIVGDKITDITWNTPSGAKWYSCRNDMRVVSRVLPELVIQVKGKGEEGEVWEYIYENGYEEGGTDDLEDFSDDYDVIDWSEVINYDEAVNDLSGSELFIEEEEEDNNDQGEVINFEEELKETEINDNIKYTR